ncbi:hypothetical protein VPH35_065524 [Triticum aestivum]|uniref:YTH domain-containing protein ECT4 n=1 Tax=Triticum aestivum TaxID=4565 RepID=UPI0008458871|nr:YTH domain-containing protein ECT4-like [Triticum aestivum]XP_044363322.1 YTH domain-containing protein ECT4-like [Triticum aestivum]
MMSGFGTNSAMGSSSLPSRVVYNTGNDLPVEYIYDQGLSYPATNGYAYYAGFEPPVGWSENTNYWGVDGQYLQLTNDNLPYVYCTPGYEFSYSSQDQYTSYMPGMFMGVDGSVVGSQQYFTNPYQPPGSPSGYFPVYLQPTTDLSSAVSLEPPVFSTGTSVASRPVNTSIKDTHQMSGNTMASRTVSSASPAIGSSHHAYQNQSTNKPSDLPGANVARHDKPSTSHLTVLVDTDKNFQAASGMGSSGDNGQITDRTEVVPVAAMVGEGAQSKAVSSSAVKNIVIHPDQYNKADFPCDHPDAKFFVIKSYSEDDVHKSIKYNVWSSTPNGNRRLDAAYSEAKGSQRKCPIFLFFSVNTSGQFCGVAEMVGPVDFHKDMDFWQQDKWSGSFPLKWHLVKDVPNSTFRHIILENNENKPVTNSRDTQEMPYKSGINMLKLFKSSPMTTSILDDFPFYEGRQKAMLEQKRRSLGRSFGGLTYVPALVAKRSVVVEGEPSEVGEGISSKDPHPGKTGEDSGACEQPDKTSQTKDGVVTQVLKKDAVSPVEQPEHVKTERHSLDDIHHEQNEGCSVSVSPENAGREHAGLSELVKSNGKVYSDRESQPVISSTEPNSSGRKGLSQESGGHDPSDRMKGGASGITKDVKATLLKKTEGLSTSHMDGQAKGIVNEAPTGVVKVGSVHIKLNVAGGSSSEIIGDGSLELKGAEHIEQGISTKLS